MRYRLNRRGKIQLVIIAVLFIIYAFHVSAERTKVDTSYEISESVRLVWQEEKTLSTHPIEEIVEEEIKIEQPSFDLLPTLHISSAKTYEDYKMITCKSSPQWDMIYNQDLFDITDDGFLITEDGFYAVALGSYFGYCGSKYVMITDEGNQIPVIVLDRKQDIHTDSDNFLGMNGDIIEFVVDSSKMPKWENGYAYGGNFNNIDMFKGNVVEIRVIERIEG